MTKSAPLRHVLLSTTVLTGVLAASAPVAAQSQWTGATSTDWFTAGNWNPAGVPTSGQSVTINTIAPNPTVVGATGAVANSVTVGDTGGSTGRLTIQGSGVLTSQDAVIVGNSGNGAATVGTGGQLTLSGGSRTIEIANLAGSTGALNIGAAIANPAVAPGNIDALNIHFGAGTGSLNFNHTGTTYQFAPTISGNGTVRFNAGTTVLTADSTAFTGTTTIASGATMQLGPSINFFGGGISTGSLSGAIVNNGAILVNRTGTLTFDSVISGVGSFTQVNPVPPSRVSITTIMNAVNTYSGATVINRGTLLMNGSNATSSMTTNNGGLLAGTGTLGNTTNNFEIAPGSVTFNSAIPGSIGTLNVAGNLTLGSNSRYFADVSQASADRIAVTGNMLLDGRLIARPNNGTYVPGQHLILSSAGRAGTFSTLTVDGNFSGLQASLSYVGTNVFLNLANFVGGTDAQWLASPGTNIFNTASNWTPATTPTGTATFGASNTTTLNFNPGTTYIGKFAFNAGAPAYTFNLDGTSGKILNFMSEGVVNNSASRPRFSILSVDSILQGGNAMSFMNASTAGNAQIEVNGIGALGGRAPLTFYDTSSAASALINNLNGEATAFRNSSTAANAMINNGTQISSATAFFDSSTAANATINNPDSSGVMFFDNATAGAAHIVNNSSTPWQFGRTNTTFGGVNFRDSSNAGTAIIINDGGSTEFGETSSAANATFINSNAPLFYSLAFSANSTAASANITNNNGGITFFQSSATAANATIVNNNGGSTVFYNTGSTGSPSITNNSGGLTHFRQMAQGPNVTIINNAGGAIDIGEDPTEAPFLVAPSVAIGSISGAGNVFLGARNLALGNLNRNDTISGVIADGGHFPDATGGSLTKVGSGTLTLTGNNTYTGATTISAGTLQLGDGGASGSVAGDVAIAGGAALVINRTGALALNGAFSGAGSLTQNGSVTTALGGNGMAFTGATAINGGTMLVDGNFANSPFTVNNGATLGGNGTVGTTTINSGATLSPGNSIGTLTINGNLMIGAGAVYRIEVSPTSADRVNVTGTAQLGGTAQLVFGPGSYTSNSYTILSAAGGRSGTFDAVTTSGLPPALSASLSYTANDVLLVTLLSSISALQGPFTPNQGAVARAQDTAFNAGLPNIAALYNLPLSQLPPALDQLSGEVHASTASVLVDESLYARSAILSRLRQASYGGNAGMAALTAGGPQAFTAEGGEAIETALTYAKSAIVRKAPLVAPRPTSDVVFWAQGFGAWGHFNSDGNAASVRRNLAGFFTGLDTSLAGNGRAGIAAGYTGSNNTLNGRGNANVETGHIAGYGGWSVGAFSLRTGADFAFHSIATDRTIAFPGFFDRAFTSYEGQTGQTFGEIGYGFALGNVALEPFAGAAWVRVKTDAAAERGGAAALNFAGTTLETGYSTLGLRAAGMIPLGHDMMLIPRASLAWQHAFKDPKGSALLAFQAAPGIPFSIAGVPIARDALLAEAGLDLAIGRNATIGVSYTGQAGRNVTDHAAKGKFSWRF